MVRASVAVNGVGRRCAVPQLLRNHVSRLRPEPREFLAAGRKVMAGTFSFVS
jgi:hypothetical protein